MWVPSKQEFFFLIYLLLDELHDLAEESTNDVFSSIPEETKNRHG